jgi:hypothetical protein
MRFGRKGGQKGGGLDHAAVRVNAPIGWITLWFNAGGGPIIAGEMGALVELRTSQQHDQLESA